MGGGAERGGALKVGIGDWWMGEDCLPWRRIVLALLILAGLAFAVLCAGVICVVRQHDAVIGRLASVHPPVHYVGDGVFRDAGESAGICRFTVDFGDIPAPRRTAYSFVASGLPRANFVIFLDIRGDDAWARYHGGNNDWEDSSVSVTVSADGKQVAAAEGKLKDWIVTNAAKEGGQFYVMDGDFDAVTATTYQVDATINPVAKMPTARLVISGGGWQDDDTNRLHFPGEY